MSPATGMQLVNEIAPIIRATVPKSVKPVGAEDPGELVQDTIALAAQLVESCEVRGKPIHSSSIAFYAIQLAKSGRRSGGATRTDAMCPAAQLDALVALESLDVQLAAEDGDDSMTLHEMLASKAEDPAQQSARELDWSELLLDCSDRDLAILKQTAEGDPLEPLARQLRVSVPRVCQMRRELGEQVRLRWGDDALVDATRDPNWNGYIRVVRERNTCRYERSAEARRQRRKGKPARASSV